jgi:hypothetical protein
MNTGKLLFQKSNVSDTFIRAYRNLFELDDDENMEPFSSNIRSLLVDSILEDLDVNLEVRNQFFNPHDLFSSHLLNAKWLNTQIRTKNLKGLSLLISEGYFDKSFILHDQSNHKNFMKILEDSIADLKRENTEYSANSIEYLEDTLRKFTVTDNYDARSYLHENWASLKNIFKFQPLAEIRDYFGEKNALYFGFAGSFITMLWLPSFVGVLFFIIGISIFYE